MNEGSVPDVYSGRGRREIIHSRSLATVNTEAVWGWGTPAGRIRARRRAALVSTAAGLCPGIRVLEVGCGTGVFTEMFAQTGAMVIV